MRMLENIRTDMETGKYYMIYFAKNRKRGKFISVIEVLKDNNLNPDMKHIYEIRPLYSFSVKNEKVFRGTTHLVSSLGMSFDDITTVYELTDDELRDVFLPRII